MTMSDHHSLSPVRFAGLAIVIGAAAVGWLIGHSTPDLKWTIHHQIFADNRTTTFLLLVLAALYIAHIHTAPVHHLRRQIGYIIVCISLAMHREVWSWWRYYLVHGDKVSADWIRDDLAWVASIAQLGMWIGFGLPMTAFLARYYGPRADWMVVAGIIGCWSAWFLISTGWQS